MTPEVCPTGVPVAPDAWGPRPGASRVQTYVSQRPYVFSQIRDSWEPAGQPPYPRPSAHTSCRPSRARGRAGRTPDGARGGGARPGTRGDGVGRGRGATRSGGRGTGRGSARRVWEAATADGAGAGRAGRPGDGLGSTMVSSASRPGGCTICGTTSCAGPPLSARGSREGPVRGSTDTHPETAATATPTRRLVVNLVRCTRPTLRCGQPLGQPEGEEWPARVTRSARCEHPGPGTGPARRPVRAPGPGPVPPGTGWGRAGKGQTPVAPSTRSRTRSAWPLCRAYSSIMCR